MTWILISNCYLSQGAWFHYLCKNITVTRDAHGKAWISDSRPGAPQLKHGLDVDTIWVFSALGNGLEP
jgi:hypothetical protein